MAANRVRLTGRLVERAQLRHSPAGVPIARFLLEHESQQREGGASRSIRFRVGVRAAGAAVADDMTGWAPGVEITVEGFLARARQRDGDNRLIISADRVQCARGEHQNRE